MAAAVGYAGTILFFTTSVSIGLSIAAGALVARSVGEGRPDRAREYATSVVMVGCVIAIGVVIAVFALMDGLLNGLGASAETHDLARSYMTIILPSMPILMTAMVAGAVLRAHGDAKRAMLTTLAGGVVNAILDPLLIFGLGLDLEGAAIASVFARFAIFGSALYTAIRVYDGFAAPKLAFVARDIRAISQIGGPAILTNIATPISSAIITREMAKFGTDAVVGMAVIGRLTPMAFAVVFSLSGAIGPIVGQNFGAGLNDRVREAFFAAMKFVALYVTATAVLLFALRGPIAGLFDAQGDALGLIYLFCGPLALAWIFNGWIFVGNASFNNLGHPFYATWINWGRATLGTWPPVLLGAWLWGASGVLLGQAFGGAVFAGVSIWLALRLVQRSPPEIPVAAFQEHENMHVLQCRRH